MSDYDEWGRFILIAGTVGLITLPIWILPYTAWWLVKGREENKQLNLKWAKDEAERKKQYEDWLAAQPPKKPKLTHEQILQNEERIRQKLNT
jgi:hypothetical protein